MLKSTHLFALAHFIFLMTLTAPDVFAERIVIPAGYLLPPPPAQVVAYEYWFDQAHDQRIFVAVSPTEALTLNLDLPTSGLANGLHTLHVRFVDDLGNWSSVVSQFFTKLPPAQSGQRQIVAYEYWFDNATAQAIEVPVGPASEVSVMADLPTAGLANGLHALHLRFRDDGGQWSGVLSQFFTKLPPAQSGQRQIVAYQYWFDNATAQAIEVPVSPASEVSVMADLPTAGLANGLHALHLRFRDDGGQWSGVLSQFFTKLPAAQSGQRQIIAYQYWFDDAFAQALEVPINPASEVALLADLPAAGLTNGLHTLHLRFRDDGGQWGGVISQFFTKLGVQAGDNKISGYRYWLDLNHADMVEVTLPSPVELLVLDENIDLSALPQAPHTIHFQFVDLNGTWSSVLTDTFNLGQPPEASFTSTIVPCANGEVSFTNTSSLATNWWWDFGDGYISTEATPIHTYSVPGIYTVTLTATDQATGLSDVFTATAEAQFLALQVDVTTLPSTCLNTNDGSASVTASNGTPPYSFVWQTGETGPNVNGLYPGYYYSVTATDANGCANTAFFIIDNGSDLTAAIVVLELTNCQDSEDGAAQMLPQNGIPPYTFLWSSGETGGTAIQLAVGYISATVTDASGCEIIADNYMSYGSDLSASIAVLENPSCPDAQDGVAQVISQGGVPPFTYLWSNDETTNTAEHLLAGYASATVTDANGCAVVADAYLYQPSYLSAYPVVQHVKCFGGFDAYAELVVSNGTPPYEFAWSTGSTGTLLENLSAGQYEGTVTDANGCQLVVPFTVQEPPLLVVQAMHTDISCAFAANGMATALLNGGTAPYSVLWSNGATDFNISNLLPDHYTATATDANGCMAVSNDAWVTQPAEMSIDLQASDAPCGNGGSITTTVAGGTPPYAFVWSNGVMVQNLVDLAAGVYTSTVTDAHGCMTSASATVGALSNAPAFSFTGNPGFESQIVNPPGGSPYQTYRFEVRYTDIEGDLPQSGYPRMYLDFEGDGNLFGVNDQNYVLTETDPSDLNAVDGKDYFAVLTGIPPSPNYQTVLRANDISGCQGSFGPIAGPGIVDFADIFLFANDIVFSNPHPDPLETITVTATLHNETDFPAQNFVCRLTNLNTGQIFADATVASLPAHGTTQVSWTVITPPDPSWNPMKVEIDVTNLIVEPNELDNQAIRPYINGDYNLPGSIAVTAAVQPNPSVLAPLTYLNLSGSAVYEGTAISLTDPSCAGASVIATLMETGQTLAGFTNENGHISIYFPQPATPGIYHITGTVTDYTLEGAFSTEFTVYPLPCIKPDLICQLEPDSYSAIQGGSLGGKIRVTNAGNAASAATHIRLTTLGATPQLTSLDVPPLAVDAFVEIALPSLTFPTVGTAYLQAEIDFEQLNEECHENNNLSNATISVTPALPDIVPVWWSVYSFGTNLPQCNNHTFTYLIKNDGGAATGAFSVKWNARNNGSNENSQTQTIASILPGGSIYVSFTHAFALEEENYLLELLCDESGMVTEYSETNNNFEGGVYLYHCIPPPVGADLRFVNCQSPPNNACNDLSVEPADPANPGDISISTLLYNGGNATATAPFEVKLLVGPSGMGVPYTLTITENIAPCQSVPVSFAIPKPDLGINTFTILADALGQLQELNEENNETGDALDWNFSLGRFCYCYECMFWEKPVTTPNMWFSVGLFNHGQYEASSVPVRFEISGPGLSGWVNLGNAVVNDLDKTCQCPVSAGLSNPFTFLTTGVYTVRMTADPDNAYPESDETDNVLTVEVIVRPDMQILSQHIAPSELHPDPDEQLTFSVSYYNVGFSNPTDMMELYLEVDGFPLDSVQVTGLLTGDHHTVEFSTPWSSNVVGPHVARAIIDHDEEIMEINESNGEATRSLVVGEAPNLRFVSLTPANYQPSIGQPLLITAIIENNGDLTGSGTYQLSYTTDGGDLIPIYTKTLTLAATEQKTFQFLWLVADAQTELVGKIINSNPLEVRYDDNEMVAVIGGLNLNVSTTPEFCVPYTGTATAIVSGGMPPYSHYWVTGQSGEHITGLGAGNYQVTVTDANGLYAVAYPVVEHKPEPELTFTMTEASCDKNDGAVYLTVGNAMAPIDILWSNGATGSSLSGLVPALYFVSVTDALGCEAEAEVVVGFDALQAGADGNCQLTVPAIFLSTGSVNAGEIQIITGSGFFPNGKAKLTVSGGILLADIDSPTDAAGEFIYSLPVPAGAPQGQYTASAQDKVSGLHVPSRYFQVVNPTPPAQDGIHITYPTAYEEFDAHSSQTIEWEERILQEPGYPYSGHYRQFRYFVDISKDGGAWERMGVSEGYEAFGETTHRTFAYEVPAAGVLYKIRVLDAFDAGNFAISEEFKAVVPDVGSRLVQLKWDFSYGDSDEQKAKNKPLKGVAADGTARIYLEINHPDVVSAEIILSDPDYPAEESTRLLGKVMPTTIFDEYSEQANGANSINATTSATNGKIVFWYVAPDDFARNNGDYHRKERFVHATLQITFSDGSVQTKVKQIRVARPPVMLVHGIFSNEKTWDYFKKFINGSEFIVARAVKMHPSASFDYNAKEMVFNKDGIISNSLNAPCFPCVIEQMRKEGYAANRVDYIAHSMGGSVLRTVLTDYKDQFYRRGIAEIWNYQNYEQGYTNKVITIGTPHEGSLVADIIDRYSTVDLPEFIIKALKFIQQSGGDKLNSNFIEINSNGISIAPAMHDLQGSGGKHFSESQVNAHLIGGDYFQGYHYRSSPNYIEDLMGETTLDLVENMVSSTKWVKIILKAGEHLEKNPLIKAKFDEHQGTLRKAKRYVFLAEILAAELNYGVFMWESDLVVHLESQLAKKSRFDNTNLKVFDFTTHSSSLDILTSARAECENPEIAIYTHGLLNMDINSNKFGPIPASQQRPSLPVDLAAKTDTICPVSLLLQDATKMSIQNLPAFTQTYLDSTLTVQIAIADTIGLEWAEVYFQGNSYTLPTDFTGTYQFDFPVSVTQLDSQKVGLIAQYTRNDTCLGVYDEVIVNVLPFEQITGFEVFPEVQYIFPEEGVLPNFRVTFPNGNSGDVHFSTSISVSIADTTLLSFDAEQLRFVGKAVGETFAAFSYSGFQDTVYFIVMPRLEDLSDEPPPIASFSFTESVACVGGDVHLENKSLYADSYLWDFGDGETSVDASPSHQYHEAGYHQVILTATNTQTGRSAAYSIAIEVEMDSIGVSIAPEGGAVLCGSPVILVATGTGNLTYQWQKNSSDLADSTQMSIVVESAGAYRVVVTNGSGCTVASNVIVIDAPAPCNKSISGILLHKGNGVTGVSQADVSLSGDAIDIYGPTLASGVYIFTPASGSEFNITPQKNTNLLNGLDVADATAIQQHIVGISTITDFFRLVAADANKSYTISTLDAAIIRQALLGNPAAIAILNKTKSWRFIPTDYAYPNPVSPYNLPVFPEQRAVTNVSSNVTGQDFYGVKVGDVYEVGSIANPANKPDASANSLILSVPDHVLKSGDPVEAYFSASNFDGLSAFQFGMRFDPNKLRFDLVEVMVSDLPLHTTDNFGTYNAISGELRVVWSVAEGVTRMAGEPLFRLRFTSLVDGLRLSDLLWLDSSVLAPVAYNSSLVPRGVQLYFSGTNHTNQDGYVGDPIGMQLLQNRPNPFTDGTVIGFVLPEACDAQLRVLDINGREILRIDKTYPVGYHEETIHLGEMTSSGVLYYELTTPYGKLIRKMALLGR